LAANLLYSRQEAIMQINSNSVDTNGLADFFQNLSNVARKSGSTAATGNAAKPGAPSAQYFNQLLNQMSQSLQITGGLNMSGAQSKAQNSLTSLFGKAA
jgi:hypothetical protein